MKRKGTGLFARYAYTTTPLGTTRHRVTNKERAEAYRLRAKHRDIMEMQPACPFTQTSAVSDCFKPSSSYNALLKPSTIPPDHHRVAQILRKSRVYLMFVDGAPLPAGPWSALAQAEWSCLVHELAMGCVEHHEHCGQCAKRFPCADIERGFSVAEDWLRARCLEEKVNELRNSP